LAESLLTHLSTLDALPRSYQLLEISESLSDRQAMRLAQSISGVEIGHINTPPRNFKGIVIANEVLDALIVERFKIKANGDVLQSGISVVNGELQETFRPAPDFLITAVNELPVQNFANYHSEVCVMLKPWLESISQGISEAIFLFSDYGFSQNEYYAQERRQGTLRCHYRHHAHNEFLRLPGLQDLTAWVNFTQLADAALELKMEVSAYTTQAHFLLGSGRLEQINFESLNEQERFKTSQTIQTLTLPDNMGERFRFMQINKNCDEVLPAMSMRDLRHQL